MESRIKMLREKRGLIQELLAVEIGVTQQMLSKYEKDITIIKVDVLKRIAEYFNVTTDYFSCNLLMDLYCSRSEHGLDVSTSRKYQPGT